MAIVEEGREYEVGEVAVIHGEFRDRTGNLVDPTTVTAKVRPPAGAPVEVYTWAGGQVTRVSLGIFERQVPITVGGTWVLGMTSTGTAATAENVTITVKPDPFA